MRIIDFNTIKNLNIDPYNCYEWVSEVIKNKNQFILPAKSSLKPGIENVFFNCMPSILPKYNIAGVKVITRYPQRIPSLNSELLLYDLDSGNPVALMDANYITALRTGAVAAHSIKTFAVKDWQTLAFIGLGNTSRATLLVILTIFPDKKFTVKLKKYKQQHIDFMNRFAEYKNLSFEICDSYSQTVQNSDIVVSAVTVFNSDFCSDENFKSGCLVIPIHTRGFTNCDLAFDKVFADDKNHVKEFKYFDKFKKFAEVCDVVNGKTLGRETETEKIIVYNIGISLHDIFFAAKINSMIDNCCSVELNQPKEKFWI